MPSRPQRYCPSKARPPENRPSAAARGYDWNWQKASRAYLRSHPLCQTCLGKDLIVAATDVDHVLAKRKGGTDDPSNLRALCRGCHSKKTVREDGGLGHSPKGRPDADEPTPVEADDP